MDFWRIFWREVSYVVGEKNDRNNLSPFPLALHHLHLSRIYSLIIGRNICNTLSSSSLIHQIQLHLQVSCLHCIFIFRCTFKHICMHLFHYYISRRSSHHEGTISTIRMTLASPSLYLWSIIIFLHLQERCISKDEFACCSQVYLGFEIISTSPLEDNHLLHKRLGSRYHFTIFWNFSIIVMTIQFRNILLFVQSSHHHRNKIQSSLSLFMN